MQHNQKIYDVVKNILAESIMFKFLEEFEFRYDVLQFIAKFSTVPYFDKEIKVREELYYFRNEILNEYNLPEEKKQDLLAVMMSSVFIKEPSIIDDYLKTGELNSRGNVYHLPYLFESAINGNCYPYIEDTDNIFFSIQKAPSHIIKRIDAEVLKNGMLFLSK